MGLDFVTAYDENVWRVYGFFAYRVTSRSDAEDLTQMTFERALRAWSRFDPTRATMGTWLIAIARNLLIDHFRSDQIRKHDLLDERVVNQEESQSAGEFQAVTGIDPGLAAALARLSPRDLEIIALRFGGDLTGSEIANVVGLSLSNVQQILSRTLRRLRADLDPERPDATGAERRQQEKRGADEPERKRQGE